MFSFGQYDRWHKRLVLELGDLSGKRVLDLCTGTGMVAQRMARGCSEVEVVAADLSAAMLAEAKENLAFEIAKGQVTLALADAQKPPFAEESFEVVVFTYLLRYVEDVPSTIKGLARLVRPGGMMASLEFGVPQGLGAKQLWMLYTRVVMPAGAFLGGSISGLYREYPMEQQKRLWEEAGIRDVKVTRLSFGGAVIIKGRKADGA